MDKELKRQIQKYLYGDPNYTQGLSLLVQASKNKILINNLSHRNSERNLKKIQWELRKAIGDNPFLEKPSKKQKKNTGSPSPEKDPKTNQKHETYPEILQRIITMTGDLSNHRDKLHRKLKAVPDVNSKSNNSLRKELLDQIREISDHLQHLFDLKDRYFREKVIPTEQELKFPQDLEPKPKAPVKDPLKGLSDAELVKKKNNVRSNLTKKKNKLNYQSTTRKKEKNPMSDGPQRDHLLHLIKKDEKLIKQIESRLENGTDKTK